MFLVAIFFCLLLLMVLFYLFIQIFFLFHWMRIYSWFYSIPDNFTPKTKRNNIQKTHQEASPRASNRRDEASSNHFFSHFFVFLSFFCFHFFVFISLFSVISVQLFSEVFSHLAIIVLTSLVYESNLALLVL